jgi:hypothetical protein
MATGKMMNEFLFPIRNEYGAVLYTITAAIGFANILKNDSFANMHLSLPDVWDSSARSGVLSGLRQPCDEYQHQGLEYCAMSVSHFCSTLRALLALNVRLRCVIVKCIINR